MKIVSIDVFSMLKKIAFRNQYDLFANDASRDVFEMVKSNYKNKTNTKRTFEYKSTKYIIDLSLSYDNLSPTKFKVFARFFEQDNDIQLPPYIEVEVVLDNGFSENDFERLYYQIYEFVRHEYEHFCQFDKDIHPSKDYLDTVEQLQSYGMPDLERAKTVEKNVLDPQEIDAYARSIMYVAKKRKVRFQVVLWEMADIMFFGFDDKDVKEGHKNQEIMNVHNNVVDKIKKRIEQIYQIKGSMGRSTNGFIKM